MMGAPDFSKFKTVIQELIFVDNKFYLATIKIDNGYNSMFLCVHDANGTNNSIKLKKRTAWLNIILAELCKYVLVL